MTRLMRSRSKAEDLKRRKDMELEEVKRKIEGEAELTFKMDKVRKTFEKEIENLKSMYPSHICSLLPPLT